MAATLEASPPPALPEEAEEAPVADAAPAEEAADMEEELEEEAPAADAALADAVADLIGRCDLNTMNMGEFRAELEQNLGLPEGGLEAKKDIVKRLVTEHIQGTADSTPTKTGKKRHRLTTSQWMQRGKKRRAAKPTSQDLPAEALSVLVAGTPVQLSMRELASGSRGFFGCQGIEVKNGSNTYHVQCLVQCVVVEVDDCAGADEAEVQEEVVDELQKVTVEGLADDSASGKQAEVQEEVVDELQKVTVEGPADDSASGKQAEVQEEVVDELQKVTVEGPADDSASGKQEAQDDDLD